jgi:tetratricopeptide (TPR) repeat protein
MAVPSFSSTADPGSLQQQIDELRKSRPRSLAFPLLTFLIIVAIFLLLVYFVYEQSTRLTAITNALRDEIVTEVRRSQAASLDPDVVRAFTQKLDYLELRQNAVLDEARGSLQRLSFIFAIIASFFGLFAIFFAFRQLFLESKSSSARDQLDQEMRGLVHSFQNNINTISSLIGTLEGTFEYRRQIEDRLGEIQARARVLETHQAESDVAFEDSVAMLNRDALSTVPLSIDRTAISYDENRRRMESFVSRLTVAERMRNAEPRLNPFCYYVRGLNNVTTYQYELAIGDLDIAARKGREDLVQPKLDTYPADQRENLSGVINTMLVSSSYFQGICYKNLGQYQASQAKFREALQRDRFHDESRNYLLQVLFFDASLPFNELEREFELAYDQLKERLRTASEEERSRLRRAGSILKINQGDMYYRKPLPLPFREGYRHYEDPEKAVKCYLEAYELHANDLTLFNLAQGMEQVGPSWWGEWTPRTLHERAFQSLKRRVAGDFDKLYSVTLYYMLAICARRVHDHSAASDVFLSQARHGLKEVPTHVTCFSPISRIRLTRPQILEEMEELEEAFEGRSVSVR